MRHPSTQVTTALASLALATALSVSPSSVAQDSAEGREALRYMAARGSDFATKKDCATRFFEQCAARGQDTTMANVLCADALSTYWDRELNRAYQSLMARADTRLRASLRQTQRTWITWRDQRCQPWGQIEGTLYRIIAATCSMETVQQRVGDLEELLSIVGE